MGNKIFRMLSFLFILTLVSCAGNDVLQTCIEEDENLAASDRIKLTAWDEIKSDNDSEEFNQPKEFHQGGEIELGANGNLLGAPGSRAKKTFDCGEGNKCSIHVYTGVFDDHEKLQITVKKGNQTLFNDSVDNVLTQPLKIEVPECKDLTITLQMTEGNLPGLASKHRVVVHTKCLNC